MLSSFFCFLLFLSSIHGQVIPWVVHGWAKYDRPTDSEVTYSRHTYYIDSNHEVNDAKFKACGQLAALSLGGNFEVIAISAPHWCVALEHLAYEGNVPFVIHGHARLSDNRFAELYLNTSVPFYPSPYHTGYAISQRLLALQWRKFAIVFDQGKHVASRYEAIFNHRTMEPWYVMKQYQKKFKFDELMFDSLVLSKIRYILVDIKKEDIAEFLSLATVQNATRPDFKYMIYNLDASRADYLQFLKGGAEFASLDLDLGSGSSTTSTEYLQGLAFTALKKFADSDALEAKRTKGAQYFRRNAERCEIDRRAENSLLEKVKTGLEEEVGTVNLPQLKGTDYNFTFAVSRLLSDRVVKMGTWSMSDQRFRPTASAADIDRESMENVTFKITTIVEPPFVIYQEEDSKGNRLLGNDRWTGLSIELWKKIARILHLTYSIHHVADRKFGSENEDGTWNGMIGELMTQKADIAVASLTITYDREKVIDFTTPYLSLGLSIIMRKPQARASMFQFLEPLSNKVWGIMILLWIVAAIVLYVVARFSPYEWYAQSPCSTEIENQFNARNSLWFTVGSLMQQGSDLAPHAISTRIVGTVWWFFTLIMISSYTANLAAFLTVERLKGDINSMDDLANQDRVKYGSIRSGSTYNFFKNSEISLYKKMYSRMKSSTLEDGSSVFVGKTKEGITRVRNSSYAFILESTVNEYYTERDCTLMKVGNSFDPRGYGIGVSPGSTYLKDQISEQILRLKKEQFVENLRDKWFRRYNITTPCSELAAQATAGKTNTLDIQAFGGIFLALLIGLLLSLATCLCEMCFKASKLAHSKKTSVTSEFGAMMRRGASCRKIDKPLVNGRDNEHIVMVMSNANKREESDDDKEDAKMLDNQITINHDNLSDNL